MATITLIVEGSAVGILSAPVSMTSDQSDRLMAYLASAYGTDADGNARTAQQMVEACWAGIVRGTLNNVEAFERERDAAAAKAAVTSVVATLNGAQV